MMYRVLSRFIGVLMLCCALSLTVSAESFVTIGTGGVTGVYYPAGGAICRLVNRDRVEHGVRCAVRTTGGSVYNLSGLRTGEFDLAIVQSDWQYHAFEGTDVFSAAGPHYELRSVFSLHPELFTLLVREDAQIHSLNDLVGKRVNIGNKGSGQRATMERLMLLKGWDENSFAEMFELGAAEQASALCDGKIDAMVYVVGHPSGSVQEATTICDAKLVDVQDADVDDLVRRHSYYRQAYIPGGLYRGNDLDVLSFGVAATLVTTTNVSDEVIYSMVKSVFESLTVFRRLHPAFAILTKEAMVNEALSAPFHSGAERYYKEVGLIE
ncbi:TAXI family TRAP transporter solute-binding subunit [Nitrincola tibetensis]